MLPEGRKKGKNGIFTDRSQSAGCHVPSNVATRPVMRSPVALGDGVVGGAGCPEDDMAGTASLDAALQRLDQALGRLELAVERRLAGERTISGLEEELFRLGEDRARLAGDLDGAMARAGRLEDTNREVSRRLVSAMESIRSVLDAHGG
jgi:hypothetical protein